MYFMLNRGRQVSFLEQDLRTPLPHKLTCRPRQDREDGGPTTGLQQVAPAA
jgi:hypothetical protein